MREGQSIIVVGGGAVGTFLSVVLSRSHPVTLLFRGEAVPGIVPRIEGAAALEAGSLVSGSVSSPHALTELQREQIVIIAVKARDIDSLGLIFSNLHPASVVVLLQNGIGIVDRAHSAGLRKSQALVRLVCGFGVQSIDQGLVRLSGHARVSIAMSSAHAEQIADLFEASRAIAVDRAGTIAEVEWSKALVNVFVNPLCSLVNRENQAVLSEPILMSLGARLVQEAYKVAQAEGVSFPVPSIEYLRQKVSTFASNVNSHLVDLRTRRPSDMDCLLGEIVRRASTHRIPVPTIEAVHDLYRVFSEQGLLAQARDGGGI